MRKIRAMRPEDVMVPTSCRLTLSDRNFLASQGLEATAVLRSAVNQLRAKYEGRVDAEIIKERQQDEGPKSGDEAASYLHWFQEHPQASGMSHDERWKAWRESLRTPLPRSEPAPPA